MIYFETEEHEHGDDVSKALFTQLYAIHDENDGDSTANIEKRASDENDDDGGDDEEDVVALESNVEILKYLEDSPPSPPKKTATQQHSTSPAETTLPSSSPKLSPFLRRLLAVSIISCIVTER